MTKPPPFSTEVGAVVVICAPACTTTVLPGSASVPLLPPKAGSRPPLVPLTLYRPLARKPAAL